MHFRALPCLVLAFTALTAQDLNRRLDQFLALPLPELRELRSRIEASSLTPWQRAYYRGLMVQTLVARGTKQEAEALEAELEHSLAELKAHPDGDCRALRASLLNQKIRLHPLSVMSLGRQADAIYQEVLAQEPNNPRLRVFYGVHLLNKPTLFGGGVDKAIVQFKAAQALGGDLGPERPRWGPQEGTAWLAMAQVKQGRKDQAKATANQVLAQVPQHNWLNTYVLPLLREK